MITVFTSLIDIFVCIIMFLCRSCMNIIIHKETKYTGLVDVCTYSDNGRDSTEKKLKGNEYSLWFQ